MSAELPVRVAAWTLALALLALPLVGLFAGWFASDHWAVRSVRVDGRFEHVAAEAVRDRIRPELEAGFFAADTARMHRLVAAMPWVAGVEVRKAWPDEVRVRVREHQPFAHWGAEALLDRAGRRFSVPGAAALPDLPRLSGPDAEQDAVLAFFLAARKALAPLGLQVSGMHLDARGSWRAELGGGADLMLGRDAPQARLERFVAAFALVPGVRRQDRVLAHVDLRYSNGFALRWAPVEVAAEGVPGA